MTLSSYISNLYGRSIYKLTTYLKEYKCQHARTVNHIRFLSRCRDNGLIAKGLTIYQQNLRTSSKASNFLNNACYNLVRERLKYHRQQQYKISKQIEETVYKLRDTLSKEDFITIERVTDKARNTVFNKQRTVHKNKFDNLLERKEKTRQTQDKKVISNPVVNLSSRPLTNTEEKVLTLGLGFAPTPNDVPVKELISSVESAVQSINDNTTADSVRHKVKELIQKASPPKPNLTSSQHRALSDLKKDNTIIILPAEIGRAHV